MRNRRFLLSIIFFCGGCSTLQVQPVGVPLDALGVGNTVETESRDCQFRAKIQEQKKTSLVFDVEIKNLTSVSWPIGPNRIFLSGAGVNQRVISAVDSDFQIASLRKQLGTASTQLASVRAALNKDLVLGMSEEKSERAKALERERVALRSELERKVSFLEVDIAEIERSRLFQSVLAPQKAAQGRVEFKTDVVEGDLLLTAECYRTSAVLRFRVVKR
ncbi:MAG: hypothetical protein K2X47_20670 [Bdellovibrionales bacterium]|nr:hypothetical protein [Bdellovibrionales bacterium]